MLNVRSEFIEGDSELGVFVEKWKSVFLKVWSSLIKQGNSLKFIDGEELINAWTIHPDHGATHSYFTNLGAQKLAQSEGLKGDGVSENLEFLAVVHDFAQFFPQNSCSDWGCEDIRLNHHRNIAGMILQFGSEFGFSEEQCRHFALSLYFHDFTYQIDSDDPLFRCAVDWFRQDRQGAILHDADKLFGAGEDESLLALGALERNLVSAVSDKAYIVRPDMSEGCISRWKYGDRWFSPWVAAVASEIFKSKFMTSAAISLNEQRRNCFPNAVRDVYGGYYDAQKAIFDLLENKLDGESLKLSCIAKNQNGLLYDLHSVGELQALILALVKAPLVLPPKYNRGVYSGAGARGWFLSGEIEGQVYELNPSVVQYVILGDGGKQAFLREIERTANVFRNY